MQGEVVKDLKAGKASKEDVDRAVSLLLELKKKLSLSGGGDALTAKKSGKKNDPKKAITDTKRVNGNANGSPG